MNIENISDYKLNSVKEQFSIGLLAKIMKDQTAQRDSMNELLNKAGVGNSIDMLA